MEALRFFTQEGLRLVMVPSTIEGEMRQSTNNVPDLRFVNASFWKRNLQIFQDHLAFMPLLPHATL